MKETTSHEQHYRKLENLYHHAPVNTAIPCRITVGEGRAEVVLTAGEEFWHSAKALHGSLYFKGLDDAAYFAANSIERECLVLTAQFQIEFLGMVTCDTLRSVGTFERRDGRKIWASSEQFDPEGNLVAKGSGLFIVGKFPLVSADHYRL